MIDNILKVFDQTKIKLIAGDLPLGTWAVDGTTLKQEVTQNSESINLASDVKSFELKGNINKDPYEGLVGAGVGAFLGLRVFGLLGAAGGALAGHYVMNGRSEVSVNIVLNDGRTCIAVMSPSMYETVKGLTQNGSMN